MIDINKALGGRIPLSPGTRVGGGWLVLGEVIGVGAGGIIYHATEPSGDHVAVKEIIPVGCKRNGNSIIAKGRKLRKALTYAVEHARNEAEILARVDHPGILKIHGIFEENDTVYEVMELLEGASLLALSGTGIGFDELLNYVAQTADALSALHRAGAIHADIKPENIFIRATEPPRACLLDFGAAFLFREGRGHGFEMTRGYAAPEQYPRAVDPEGPRTDIYSLSATLYHLLSGKLPPESLKLRRKQKYQSLGEMRGDVPEQISAAVHAGLSIDPARRPADAETFSAMMGIEAQPWHPYKLEMKWQADGRATPIRSLATSGDGRVIAAGAQNGWALFSLMSGEQEAIRLRFGTQLSCVTVSNRADRFVTGNPSGKVQVFNTKGELQAILLDDKRVGSVTFDPSNQYLAAGMVDGRVILWDGQGTRLGEMKGQRTLLGALAFSADSSLLASGAYDGSVVFWEVASQRQLLTLRSQEQILYDMQFSPHGKLFATAAGDATARVFLVENGAQVRSFRLGGKPIRGVAFSPDSEVLALASEEGPLELYNLASGRRVGRIDKEQKLVGVEWTAHGLVTVSESCFFRGWEF